jgi:hypothetical protein
MKRISKAIYFLFFFLSSLLGLAQVSTYTFNETVVSYNPLISGTTVAYSAPWDNNPVGAAHLANIGFNFTFDGVVQSQCFISPNGFITFGTQATATTYLPLSVATPLTGGGAISALGMDLISNTDNVVYATIGTAPNRTFVVQWSNAVRKAGTGNFNFQIRLNESSNTIQLSYGVCAPDGAAAVNTQVGIRGESSVFLQGNVKNRLQNGVNVNSTWSTKTIEGTANSSTVRTSLTEYPNDGLLYTFAPSLPCTTPTANASGLIIGATNLTATSFVGNSFTAASPAPTNYLILRSTINTPPTALNIPNRTYFALGNVIAANYTVVGNTNATIFNQTGLAPNTTYYYWVIPYNAGCLGGPFYRLTGMLSASNTTCVAAPTGLVASTVEGNSFTASWAPVTGATDYLIDVSTTNTFTSILPGYNNLSTAGATSIPVTGLNSVTTYYFRVRAVGSSCFFYSATRTVTTVCGSFPIPYFQSFDTTPVNTTPQCFTITDENSDATIWQVRNTQSASNPNSIHLNTNTAIDSDDWFFTPGLQLNSGVTYRLRFKYNTESAGLFSENLRIRLGSGASVSDMSLTLLNLPNTVNTVYQTALVDFTIFLDGVYFLGFQGYSLNSQSKIIIDDISVIVSPTCFEPTNLKVTAIGSNTASISWDESVPPPSDGYQYYVSTSSNMPNATDTPTGSVGAGVTSVNLSGLSSATLYYFWVRGNCSPTDQSVWSLVQSFSTDCATPALIPVIGGTLCGGGSTTLQATPAPGATIEWFSNAAGTILVGTGDNFTTPNLFATTTFYAQSVASCGLITVGPSSPITQGGALGSDNNPRIINFNVATVTDLQSIDIFPIASGQSGTITIKNTFNSLVGSASYTTVVAGGSTPQTIPLNVNLLPGSYTFAFDTLPAAGLVVNVDSATYPYSSSVATITGNDFDNIFYMYAYNWKFSNICRSLLTPVVATITPAPPISLSQSSASICFGDTTSVVSLTGFPAYDTLVWSPATAIIGDENTGYTFNPTTTTNYTLTAAQTSGSMCVSVLNFDVTVRPEPPAIGVVPATATLCEGQTQILNAALSSSTPVVILEEGFNAPTNNWIVTQTSTGGDITASQWTLRNSPYTYTSPYWVANNIFTSNDSSQFYLANSDAQGPPASNRTVTYLESPTFNLTGYTSANISFWHFLRYIPGNRARVEASINGGATWTTMASFITPRGTAAVFENETVNLNTLIGNPAVKLRFYYDASWDYGWAIDNVRVTGNLAIEVVWSPATELYFDAAATNPYIAGTPAASVYAKPTTTTTYTGTALGSNGCFTDATALLTVVSSPTLGTLSSNQTVCANWNPADIVLTGYTNNIVNWQYASDAAFTVGVTPIANTTDTLTGAAMGVFAGNRYFRAVLQNGTCPVVYTSSVLIDKPATAWDGTSWSNGLPNATKRVIFSGNFNSTGNIIACGVEVLSGNVVFNAGHTLIVHNDIVVTGGNITFQNNASLVQLNTLNNLGVQFSNSGNITYRRTTTPIKSYDYTYWSSPVAAQQLGTFSAGTTHFYQYNPSIVNWSPVAPSSTMTPAKGYIIRTPDIAPFNNVTTNLFTGSFIGTPNTGTITTPIIGTATPFNLIGNPYPSAISADLFLSHLPNQAVLDATLYLWTHNTPITSNQYTSNDYAMYNFSGGVGTGNVALNPTPNNTVPNGRIASGQSFFIKGMANGSAEFNNSMRLIGQNNQFFRTTNQEHQNINQELEKHRFWLDIYNETGAFKELLVAYVENATNGIDRGFDGELVDIGNPIMAYTLLDNTKLTIQGKALPFNQNDTIPLGYKATVQGNYAFSLANFDGLFTTQDIYLEDKVLNTVTNLKETKYNFTTTVGTFDERFLLRFMPTGSLNNDTFTAQNVLVYKNEQNNFVITTGNQTMSRVKIFDTRGRLINEQKNINANQATLYAGETNQVLLLQITTDTGITVTKKVIR